MIALGTGEEWDWSRTGVSSVCVCVCVCIFHLSIFAIKVGDTTLEMLDINNELNLDLPKLTVDNPTYRENENISDEKKNLQKKLPVFDVLLAGVESDG